MSYACSPYSLTEVHTKFLQENMKERDRQEVKLCRDSKIFKMDIKEIGWEDVDWTHLAQIWTSVWLL
jgi:hypothetical protein